MNKETRKALEGSIKKWERIVAGTGVDDGVNNCPLCEMFMIGQLSCRGCPVRKATGHSGCWNTPHEDWETALEEIGDGRDEFPRRATDDETVMCAVLELEFLKSLRPK